METTDRAGVASPDIEECSSPKFKVKVLFYFRCLIGRSILLKLIKLI